MCNKFKVKRTHNVTHLIDLKFGKYSKVHNDKNIVVGKGELVWSDYKQGWINLSGDVITDRVTAIKYAKLLNDLYQYNIKRIAQSKIRF